MNSIKIISTYIYNICLLCLTCYMVTNYSKWWLLLLLFMIKFVNHNTNIINDDNKYVNYYND